MKPDGLTPLLLAGTGGFVGSALRYWVSYSIQRLDPAGAFPLGTLGVNVAGCLVIGVIAGLSETRSLLSAEARVLVLIGVLGGFTTFSTFGWETLTLLREGAVGWAGANVAANVAFGMIAVWLGWTLATLR